MDTNVLKQDLNKVWFDLKETKQIQKEKNILKHSITFNESASRYEVGLPFNHHHKILNVNYFKGTASNPNYTITNVWWLLYK